MDFSPPEALRLVQAYVAASQPLNRWIGGAQAFVLLSAAAEAGMLDAARSPSSTSEIAATTGLDPAWVSDLTVALEAYGIFDRDGDRYHLSQDFALLASPDALLALGHLLRSSRVYLHTLEALAATAAVYTEQPTEELFGVAHGIGTSALSPVRQLVPTRMGQLMPEIQAIWLAGGQHLEVGCGAGNNLLSILATYPAVRAVGVEIDAATIAEAGRRATVLELTSRVELR